jgi:hypothetical protein
MYTIDHFVDLYGNNIDIYDEEHELFIGLNSEGKLKAEEQPLILCATELPSITNNSSLCEDIVNAVFNGV